MSDIGTKAGEVRKALANDTDTGILQVWSGLQNKLKIWYGFPGEVDTANIMWFFGITWPEDQWANATRHTRDETFEIGFVMEVRTEGESQATTTDLLLSYVEEVQKALRQDVRNPTGVAGVYQVEVIPRSSKEGVWGDQGRWADFIGVVRCKARH